MRPLPTLVAAAVLALATVAAAPAPAPAPAEPTGRIHPGIQTITDGSGCTANFVFEGTRTVGGATVRDLYIGMAAHCAGTDGNTATNGCSAGTLPLGTPVELESGRWSVEGTLAYSSWVTMQAHGETDPDACAVNDFALVRIPPSHHHEVDPTVPYYGGPGPIGGPTSLGDTVRAFGNSSLRFDQTATSPQRGVSLGTSRNGWTHRIYQASPGIPGDSGSAVLHADGRALGVVVTLQAAPYAGSNGVTDLGRALAYANAHGGLGTLRLIPGRVPFADPVVP